MCYVVCAILLGQYSGCKIMLECSLCILTWTLTTRTPLRKWFSSLTGTSRFLPSLPSFPSPPLSLFSLQTNVLSHSGLLVRVSANLFLNFFYSSGSMSGMKIQKTKDTMQIFLRSLPLGTLFNVSTSLSLFSILRLSFLLQYLWRRQIVGFGSNFLPLFREGSKEYDDSTLAQATQYVSSSHLFYFLLPSSNFCCR
jgi:hypothetical protein